MRQRSDGATLELTVATEGAESVVSQWPVRGSEHSFKEVSADLSRFSGKTVELSLRTKGGRSNDADYVFVGAPSVASTSSKAPVRVLVIGLDTTRPDRFGTHGYPKQTTPGLDQWARTATVFDRAWTPAPRTRPSFRSSTTGRTPLTAICAKNVAEVFAENGFVTSGVVANVHLHPRFHFDDGFDSWSLEPQANVVQQTTRAWDWLQAHQHQDSYLFLHIMDPHIVYQAPGAFERRFVDELALGPDPDLPTSFNNWDVRGWIQDGTMTPRRMEHISAQYDAELLYTDTVLSKFLKQVESLPGDTLIVIHNDHGEELFEHGGFEHNHTLFDEVARGLLWIKPPNGTQTEWQHSDFPATLTDIAPTIFEFAGFDAEKNPPLDGVSLVPAMRGETTSDWTRPIPIAHLRHGRESWGMVWKNHKYILVTSTGEEQLYDLEADPGEQNNLVKTSEELPEYRDQLQEAHDIPVGLGWHINVKLDPGSPPIRITLPQKPRVAGVIDPQSTTKQPVNQAWGVVPPSTAKNIGDVKLEGNDLVFTPGSMPTGKLFVLFDAHLPANTAKLERRRSPLIRRKSSTATWKAGEEKVKITNRVVLAPPPNEMALMQRCSHGEDRSSAEEMNLLEILGYLREDTDSAH